MSENSWYLSLLFWLFLEEEPSWKNFKTNPDASFYVTKVTQPPSFFLTERSTLDDKKIFIKNVTYQKLQIDQGRHAEEKNIQIMA